MRVWKVAGNVVFSEDLTARPIVPLPDKHAITVDADEGTYIFSVPTPELASFLVEAANAWEQRAERVRLLDEALSDPISTEGLVERILPGG